MLTLEFKLAPTVQQETLLKKWMSELSVVWNRGLALLEWRQFYLRLQKCLEVEDIWGIADPKGMIYSHHDEKKDIYGLACQAVHQRRIDKSLGWEVEGNVEAFWAASIPKPHWLTEPPISHFRYEALRKPFNRSAWQDERVTMPQMFVNELIWLLARAWGLYQKGKLQRPRYKKPEDRQTIESRCSGEYGAWAGNRVKLPGLGKVLVCGLSKRLKPGEKICSYRICQKASGWYFQIAVNRDDSPEDGNQDKPDAPKPAPPNNPLTVTVDPNHPEFLYQTDRWAIPSLPINQEEEKRLKRFQRRQAKCQKDSRNHERYKNKIGKLHEKIRRRRRSYQHHHSAILSRVSSKTGVEVKIVKPVPLLKPDPKIAADGKTYLPNGATKKSEANRKRLDAGLGQFRQLLKEKSNFYTESEVKCVINDSSTDVRVGNLTPVESSKTLKQEGSKDSPRDDIPFLSTSNFNTHFNTQGSESVLDSGSPEPPKPNQPKVSVRKRPTNVLAQPSTPDGKPGLGITPNYPQHSTNRRLNKKSRCLQEVVEKPVEMGLE